MTEDEVLQILNLIEKSSFDFLQLELGDLKLMVSKSGYIPGTAAGSGIAAAPVARPVMSSTAETKEPVAQAKPARAEAKPIDTGVVEGAVAITAPIIGTFYTAPEPGAAPFVQLGGRVDEDATVGLIEVMKVFNAVKSGAPGVIAKICVENGQFVEYGQTLFLVRPEVVLDNEDPPE